MNKLLTAVAVFSCLSGIIGFSVGAGVSYVDDRAQLQALFDLSRSAAELADTPLGRSNPSFWAAHYLAAASSEDPEEIEQFRLFVTPQVVEYAGELKIAIERAEDTENNLELYKETLAKIEQATGIETHNK